jgi:ubiquinone/menaquinone biosynthesis C-methylase UbiE
MKRFNSEKNSLDDKLKGIPLELERFREIWSKHKNIYLYGTGKIAEKFVGWLRKSEMDFAGFIVSDGRKKEKIFLGYPVYELSENVIDFKEDGVVLALGDKNKKVILPMLQKCGVENIYEQTLFGRNDDIILLPYLETGRVFIEDVIDGKMLCADQIKGKKVLLIGSYSANDVEVPIDKVLKQIFEQYGAECLSFGGHKQSFIDYVDDIENLSEVLKEKTFDIVLVVEGLEKVESVIAAVGQIKKVCKENGTIIVFARTPIEEEIEPKLEYHEDFWRYETEDMIALFRDCCLEEQQMSEEKNIIALKFRKDASYVETDYLNLRLYSNRLKKRIEYDVKSRGYFAKYRELSTLGKKSNTDKNIYNHNYLDKYEFFLKSMRNETFTLLELGVFHGESAKMWKKYFNNAQIIGVDIDDACKAYEEERIKIVISDLSGVENLEQLKKYQPLIIIDDASHLWSHQIKALFTLFDALPSGGIYIVEDLETSFNYGGRYYFYEDACMSAADVCLKIAEVVTGKRKLSENDLFNKEIEVIAQKIEMVSFINGSCILVKR